MKPMADSELLGSLTCARESEPVWEIKFLLSAALAEEVERWACEHLASDARSAAGGRCASASLVSTLCLDTPELDLFHRSQGYRRRSFRVRRYGDAPWLWLERRTRRRGRVSTRRVAIPDRELDRLAGSPDEFDGHGRGTPQPEWIGAWFHERLHARRLRPACWIGSSRTAFEGPLSGEPIRLSLDREVRGSLVGESSSNPWSALDLDASHHGSRPLTDCAVLELKVAHAIPHAFKSLMFALRLSPSSFSKYRRCQEVWMDTRANAASNHAIRDEPVDA